MAEFDTTFEKELIFLSNHFKNRKDDIAIYLATPIIRRGDKGNSSRLTEVARKIENVATAIGANVIDSQATFVDADWVTDTKLTARGANKMGEALLFGGDFFLEIEQFSFPTGSNLMIATDPAKGIVRGSGRFIA